MSFNDFKQFNGMRYTGAAVGHEHEWDYNDAVWNETKISPDLWKMQFSATKSRRKAAPVNSGAELNTEYHWTIVADQMVRKIDANHYETLMQGMKFKTGYKKPFWKGFSYTYPDQPSKNQQKIKFLQQMIKGLEEEDNVTNKS